MTTKITIQSVTKTITDCESVIIVPEVAINEAGYIKTFTVKNNAHAKHEYHAMAQMAYFQFQDDELEVVEIDSLATIRYGDESFELDRGLILCRNTDGAFNVLIHVQQNKKKLFEAAYRYCTRWVRLDI
jgi:hypothetical protein